MFADVRQLQSLLCGITDPSNYDPATFTGNVFCDWNRGDLNYRHGGSEDLVWSDTSHSWEWANGRSTAWGSYGKGVRYANIYRAVVLFCLSPSYAHLSMYAAAATELAPCSQLSTDKCNSSFHDTPTFPLSPAERMAGLQLLLHCLLRPFWRRHRLWSGLRHRRFVRRLSHTRSGRPVRQIREPDPTRCRPL